jgi:predicted DNA-binding protein (MmcQ/YjbR family)
MVLSLAPDSASFVNIVCRQLQGPPADRATWLTVAGGCEMAYSSWHGSVLARRRVIMPAKSVEDPRLTRLTKICLALPEAQREVHGRHAAFLVKKKKFVYFLDDHHGDGIVGVTARILPGDNEALVAAQPKRFYMPAYLAHRGWVALRLDTGKIDWDEVVELVATSYRLMAPKRLAAEVRLK